MTRPRIALALALATLAAACGDGRRALPRGQHTSVVAAGDIAGCWWRDDESTARLLDQIGGTVVALGDNVYQDGSAQQYARCYAPTWGRHKDRTRPIPGNHDYRTGEGEPYYDYFGAAAGPRGKGWYSYDLEGWHVVALNSEVDMTPGSEQLRWLADDLRRNRARCTLAYMHRPRFSSGKHGPSERVKAAFRVLYEGGVDVVLGGHDHIYERFSPQDPDGRLDMVHGVRQFVVGTGGAPFYEFRNPLLPNSETHQDTEHGVLRLVFEPGSYTWEFVSVGNGFTDSGSSSCH